MPKRPASEVLHVRIPKPLLEAIRKSALSDSRTVNFMARELIEQGLIRRAELEHQATHQMESSR